MNALYQSENKTHVLEVFYDEDASSPREDDNLGIMVTWTRQYSLGDKHDFKTPDDFAEWEKEHKKEILMKLPLYLFDHSGLSISTGSFHDPWDSGQVGWIYTTKERVKELGSPSSKKKLEEYLKGEVALYDQFLKGDCYGYKLSERGVEDDSDKKVEIDSCWGFYGTEWKENGLLDNLGSKYKELVEKLRCA